jgi:cobalt transport protein ATP-binding subunit
MTARGGIPLIGPEQEIQTLDRREMVRVAIEMKNVSFNYGDYKALCNISFSLPSGSKTALLGHNGAGKSTLISLLNGLSEPSEGEVLLAGEKLDKKNRVMARQRVGVVYQDPDDQIFSATVEDDVAFGPKNLGLPDAEVEIRVERALSSVGLREFRNRSPFELSYGQKRRVAIAGVIAMQPEIIIMDEPMAFLDPKGRVELQSLLESLHLMGMTIMIATHDIDFVAEWADRVLILKDGKVYVEGPIDLLFDEQLLDGVNMPLPRLAQPFRLLRDIPFEIKPKNVREAAQWIWRLMMGHERQRTELNDSNKKCGGSNKSCG